VVVQRGRRILRVAREAAQLGRPHIRQLVLESTVSRRIPVSTAITALVVPASPSRSQCSNGSCKYWPSSAVVSTCRASASAIEKGAIRLSWSCNIRGGRTRPGPRVPRVPPAPPSPPSPPVSP
jgi:hypothetical protein